MRRGRGEVEERVRSMIATVESTGEELVDGCRGGVEMENEVRSSRSEAKVERVMRLGVR